MGTRDLPDMYALSPRACGPRALGIHIRQILRAHVITITCILYGMKILWFASKEFEWKVDEF